MLAKHEPLQKQSCRREGTKAVTEGDACTPYPPTKDFALAYQSGINEPVYIDICVSGFKTKCEFINKMEYFCLNSSNP